jgi:hypothetical protein
MNLSDEQIVEWLGRSLDRSSGRIGFYVPAGFACYVRILHAAQNAGDGSYDDVTWGKIAAASGRELTPLSTSDDIWAPEEVMGPKVTSPLAWLSERQCPALAAVLAEHTSTPSQCAFLFHGSWATSNPSGPGVTTIQLPESAYAVVRGACSQTCSFEVGPSMWWPADRAWFAVTIIDMDYSLVGCSRAAMQAILDHPAIEAFAVSRADPAPLSEAG